MARLLALPLLIALPASAVAAEHDWPSYNRSLMSDRYVSLDQISRANVAKLKVACTYDTGQKVSFQTGPLVVDGTLYATTEKDIFAIDATTCKERWRTAETYEAAGPLKVNRGAAYLDGRLFRGTQDGRVLAYDAKTGKRLWETRIADPKLGETVPAAPIAWSGLVFVGNAGGDNYGVKGRMYALVAATGKIAWEFYLVPKDKTDAAHQGARSWGNPDDIPIAGGATWTSYSLDPARGLLYVPGGNPAPDFKAGLRPGDNLFTNSVVVLDAKTGTYKAHYSLVPEDFHDWDVSAAPALFTDKAGKRLLAAAPKDGHLYGIDLDNGKRLYRTKITTVSNETAPLTVRVSVPARRAAWNGTVRRTARRRIWSIPVQWTGARPCAWPTTPRYVASARGSRGRARPTRRRCSARWIRNRVGPAGCTRATPPRARASGASSRRRR
jgi:alcohol dehydrogenase (cytochrome c)